MTSGHLDPHTELHIERKRQEDRSVYEALFASKWVESFARWLIIGVGAAVLAALMKLILV